MKFLFGITVGLIVGFLYAPAPGEETRERLYHKLGEYSQAPQRKVADVVEQNREKVADMGARLGREAVESAVDSVTEKLRNDEKTA